MASIGRVSIRGAGCPRCLLYRLSLGEYDVADSPAAHASGRNAAEGVLGAPGVSQVEAAKRMRVPFQRLNAIVKGPRAVSADTAILLEPLTGWDAQIWMTLQAKWDLWHALRARAHRPKVKPLQAIRLPVR
jgi:addiction module HigA family antidote